jgi:hypothetical protein
VKARKWNAVDASIELETNDDLDDGLDDELVDDDLDDVLVQPVAVAATIRRAV